MTVHEREDTPRASGAPGALVARRVPGAPRAAVLFLHGGRSEGRAPSRPWHLAALRMRPFVWAVASALPDDEVFLGEVRYRVRGWNGGAGDEGDALRDVRRALDELARRAGDVPVVLVGHSMGGRAALRAAGSPQVRAVLALAPWCPDGEPVTQLRDKDVVVLHGDRDRVTEPGASVAFVARARAAGARADVRLVPGGDHAMLRGETNWHRLAASTAVGMLPA
ncbi:MULTISPECIES: alpha/beta hydrolase [Streptomyces]|uniref:Alpha/beta fold hydrolase n=1 Tax=Streptomyces koelreuteriae TaxID=2838015 RepID=A0ABX8FT85_9ACTN|nr:MULTISPECIES: alpha/beta fold hydrolase [Streptomyces]QWB24256.1 alpha/beta fold hydrolase [Streptomyces koelreuteriae]UUA07255.1 alpha/beta fold hydrolase [Streptomyces koelreuteriae]UUA14884.1 alpha/beta fold hydrolase [Streptomyces sp. CRCS-T-1]